MASFHNCCRSIKIIIFNFYYYLDPNRYKLICCFLIRCYFFVVKTLKIDNVTCDGPLDWISPRYSVLCTVALLLLILTKRRHHQSADKVVCYWSEVGRQYIYVYIRRSCFTASRVGSFHHQSVSHYRSIYVTPPIMSVMLHYVCRPNHPAVITYTWQSVRLCGWEARSPVVTKRLLYAQWRLRIDALWFSIYAPKLMSTPAYHRYSPVRCIPIVI